MLNHETINKIAAGEVIIRPVSVIKELVENAIDAGANRIRVAVENGGKTNINVTDNGVGIAYNEVPLAFKRHATSKLLTIDDLETIHTLGFRGEALSSIAAVARVRITTRAQEEEIGSQAFFENGKMLNQRVVSYDNGTEILVSDLFYNTPARQKHLQKGKSEEKLVRDVLEKLALSHPDIGFTYVADNRAIFQTMGNGKLKDFIERLYCRQIFSGLRELDVENAPMRLTGYISDLTLTRSTREEQIFFINQRYVKSKCLADAFEAAYEGYMMVHRHPVGIIFMELPGRMLDVNIHPAKTEIQILNESLVSLLFKQGIRDALKGESLIVDAAEVIPETVEQEDTGPKPMEEPMTFLTDEKTSFAIQDVDSPQIMQAPDAAKAQEMHQKQTEQLSYDTSKSDFSKARASVQYPMPGDKAERVPVRDNNADYHPPKIQGPDFTNARIVGQLFSTYILLEKGDEILMLDQHAAHEAFMYEELSRRFASNAEFPAQHLMVPQVVEISVREAEAFEDYRHDLLRYGFDCDQCGPGEIMVRSVPIILGEPQDVTLLKAFIESRSYDNAEDSRALIERIITMSCKSAVKGHQELSREEIKTLLDGLSRLDNPYTCPHGRPIILRLKEYELKKLFKRVI